MDIVIPYAKSNTDELRYCLRSLKNIPHDKVFICGDKPDFISDKVIYLPRALRGSTAQYDSELNIRLALLDERLSNDFILFNDDFYIMKPIKRLHTYQNGTLKDLIDSRPQRQFLKHNIQVQNTIDYLHNFDNPLSFELHIPMVFNKQDRLEVSNTIIDSLKSGKVVLPRSIYGNIFCDINEYRKDVKLYTENDKITDDTFLSTYEATFNSNLGDIIRSRFKDKCEYEQ